MNKGHATAGPRRQCCISLAFFFILILMVPGPVLAMQGYLSDINASFSNPAHQNTCGACHSSWSGGRARGDFALNYKLWDYTGISGMSRALLKIDVFNTGASNEWKVLNPLSGDTGLYGETATSGPYSFSGAADKDGDGYIDMLYRTERAGMPNNWTHACSVCTGGSGGGNKGAMPSPPAGWDIDDNDATQGNIPWDWNSLTLSDPSPNAAYDADAPLSNYWSSDNVPPNNVTDLRLDVSQWPTEKNSKAIPLTWTAPADDDPAIGGPDVNKPVHHYDIRYTTATLLDNYNSNFSGLAPAKLCSAAAGQSGQVPCQIRNRRHWRTLFQLSDCGIDTGSGQEYLTHNGVVSAADANSCGTAGAAGWDRGIATPLIRALYESGFEDEESPGPFSTCPPCGPKAPGQTEAYLLTEITNKHIDLQSSNPYTPTTAFAYTDIHDGQPDTQPNYIADGTVYWIQLAADDGVVHPWVELTDVNGDGVIEGGPFREGVDGSGNGFAGYQDPGFSEDGNIIAIKAGPYGAAITNISDGDDSAPPVTADASDTAAQMTITGIGFQQIDPDDGINVVDAWLVSADGVTVVRPATTTTVDSDTQVTALFDMTGLSGDYTVELRNGAGETVAAWVDAAHVTSTSPGEIVLDAASYQVTEGPSATVTVTVLRQGGSSGAASVEFSTSDGTATNGGGNGLGDYDTVDQVINWPDGNDDPVVVTIPINDDAIIEPDETVNLGLSAVVGSAAAPGAVKTALLTITDNELNPGKLQFVASTSSIDETAGTATFLVERTGGTDGAVSIDYATVDGDATDGGGVGLGDYDAVSGTLNWADGVGGSQQITVTIHDDADQEATEYFNIDLFNAGGSAQIGLNDPLTVTIADDDTPSTFNFSVANYTVTEGNALATVEVTRTGTGFGTVSVDYATTDNTATAGDDYTAAAGTLTWADSDTANKSFTVPINGDTTDEANEVINLSLANPVGYSQLGTQDTATLTINDDDSTLQFSGSSYSRDENLTPATITVTRQDITSPPTYSGAVTVDYATADDSAQAGVDYAAAGGTLSWADGESTDKTFSVVITDDSVLEQDETVSLTLSSVTGNAETAAPDNATLTILDDESSGTLQFSAATYSVNEDGGVDATITVTRTGGSAGALTVDYATADGDANTTATAGADYTSTSGTLSWADGDSVSQVFTVPITNDSLDEDPDETVQLELSNPTLDSVAEPTVLGSQDTALLTIIDSVGTLQFDNSTYSVAEDGGVSATIMVTRTGGSNGSVSVDYATADNTATAGLDYTAAGGTLVWSDGDSTGKQFTVPVTNDSVDEDPDETVDLALTNVTGGATLGTDTAVLTIIDSVGTLQFDSATYSVAEDGGVSATITVTRTGGSNGSASVDYATADNTATAGLDYTAAGGTLNWADGDSAGKSFTVAVSSDTVIETGGETVSLALSAANGAALGSQDTALLTITDGVGRVEFVSAPYSFEEDAAGTVTVTVQRVDGSGGQFDVPYATSDATATIADNDYNAASGTLSWADGETGSKTFNVVVNSDRAIEGDETVSLGLAPPAQAAVNTTLTLANDDFAGSLQLNADAYNVDETAGTVTVTVTRSGGDVGAVSVDYATTDNTATDGVDYTAASGTLNWADLDSTDKTFTVPITNDTDTDPGEDFTVTLSNVTGAGASLGSPAAATVNILDNESPGTLQFSSATYSVNEDGGVDATITVTRTGGSSGALTVDYATADNTATAGVDYTAASGMLSWADGEYASKTFVVPITNDSDDEADEIVDLSLTNVTGGATLGTDAATLTIVDSFGILQFDSATYSVAEDGGVDATITVTRIGGSNGAVSVDYATADNTAASGLDYTAATGTLNWADNDSASKTFTVSVIDDALDEDPDETVDLALGNVTGGAQLGSQDTAVLTIVDSVGILQFDSATYSVAEDGGVSATITVTRTGGSNGPATVVYSTADNTATAGLDYTAAGGTLSWTDGDSTSRTFTVPITNDSLDEDPDETVDLSLTNVTGARAGTLLAATLTITDSVGDIQFSTASYNIAESGGSATITVTRIGGSNGAASVDYATADNTATAGDDYTAAVGTLNWADGDSADKTFTVAVASDSVPEGDETVDMTLSSVSGARAGAPAAAVLTITDHTGSVEFSSANYTVAEDGPGTVTITVSRSGGSGGSASVDYATADGTADDGGGPGAGDYDSVSGTLFWGDGESADKTFTVPVNSDTLSEGSEAFSVALSNPSGVAIGTTDNATVTITDGPGSLQFSSAAYSVNEDGSGQATISVTRDQGSGGAVSVDYATADNTATAGADYTATSGTLSWTDGDTAAKSFTILISNDAVVEDPDEIVSLSLSNPQGGALLGGQNSADLTIIDSAGTLQFSSAVYSVDEDGINAVVTVTRSGGSNGAASVTYITADGSAVAGSDYTAATGTLNWADGDSAPQDISIPVTDDGSVEGDETFTVSLNGAGGASLGSPATATVTIEDNDIAGNLEFAASGYAISENGGGVATITVRRTLGSIGAVSVDYATADGTATVAGGDYTAAAGTLSWADGDSSDRTFTVNVAADNVIEAGGEVVLMSLNNPTGGATMNQGATAQRTAQLRILDSPGSLQFTATDYPVNEEDGLVTVSVARVNGSGGTVSVNYAATAGTATQGSDFIATSGMLTWVNGDTAAKTFTVTVNDDELIEADETVNLALSNAAGGAALGTPASATATIVSDDQSGTVRFGAATYSKFENGGLLTVTLSRVNGSAGDIAVYYRTKTDGSGASQATADVDYTSIAPTRVEWLSGDTTDKTFTVAVLDDADYEGNETFLVTLQSPEGTVVTTPGTAVITITNDDSPTGSVRTIDPGWHMISIPSDLVTDNHMSSLFLDDFGAVEPFVQKRVSNAVAGSFAGSYLDTDIAVPGEGYFIRNDSSVAVTLDDQTNGAQSTDPYEITLQIGGGIIGNPYPKDIDVLQDVRVCDFTTSGGCLLDSDWFDWSEATGNGWLTGTLYGYDNATANYTMKNPADGTMIMSPWEGYWIRTEVTDTIRLRFYDNTVPP